MKTFALWLHAASTVLAYAAFGLLCVLILRTTNSDAKTYAIVVVSIQAVLAAIGFVSGLGLMITRKGRDESIALAASTIVAFIALILAMAIVV
jgi:hypothetical protein